MLTKQELSVRSWLQAGKDNNQVQPMRRVGPSSILRAIRQRKAKQEKAPSRA